MCSPSGIVPVGEKLLLWQASGLVGISPDVLRKHIRAGVLPAQKLPGSNQPYLVRREDLETFARSRQAVPA